MHAAPIMTDATITKLKQYFTKESPLDNRDFAKNEVVIWKEDCGIPGSTDNRKAYTLITTAMEEKFGAAKHFVVSSWDGEPNPGNTKYCNVQEQFVGNPFKETFTFQNTEERIKHIRQSYGGGESTLPCIQTILSEANSLYNSLNTSNKWNVPHRGGCASSCQNCGGKGHRVTQCKKRKDQNRITENKKKWEEETGKSSKGGGASGNYERKKWGEGRDSNRNDTGHGVKQFNNVWHMLCNKGCGWNTTHTTGFHRQFLATPSAYPAALPPTHPYQVLVAKSGGPAPPTATPPAQIQTPSIPSTNRIVARSSLTLTKNQLVINYTKWKSFLDHHKRTSENAKVAALCSLLKELLN